MSNIATLLQELEQEAHTTRRVLERVPGDRLQWKPHDKSMTLGQLSLHIAMVPGAIAEMSQHSPCPVPEFVQPAAASTAEVMSVFEESVATAKRIVAGLNDEGLASVWRLVDGPRDVMAMPVGALLRMLMLNHWYHHRGQLSVYLRQLGVPVPSIYGPSADETPFESTTAAASAS